MNGIRYFRFFNFLLSFSLLVAPLPLPILAHDMMLIENFEDFPSDDYCLSTFIYLGRDLSPLADFVVTVSSLDNDINSPLHQLKTHIEKGFLVAEQYAVAQALYHAEIILQKNYQRLDQSHARKLYDDLEEIAQKILNGMLKRAFTNIAVVNGLLSVNDQLVQNITAVDLSVTDAIMMAGTINMLTQNEVRFQDSAGGQYVGLNAQSVVPTSYTLSLPTTVPTGNQVLRANGVIPTNLEWVTEGGSVVPVNSKTIYVTKYGNDITGDGSFATPYASLSKAITTANSIASTINPICILISAGIYTENNSSGPLAITANGISIVGETASGVIIMPNTPANNLLTIGNTIRIADITFQSSSPLATGLSLTAGTLTVLNNVRVFNFLIGVDCSGGATQTYGFSTCFFVNNGTALNVNSTRVECNSTTIFGTSVITGPAVNTGMNVTGAASSVVFTGGVIGLCATGANIINNSTVTLSSVSCRLNAFDIVQNGASRLTLSGCTFELTDSSSDIDIQVSGSGTIAEIIACEFSGASVLGATEGTSIVVSGNGTVNITGGVMHNYTTGIQVGTSLDTSSTMLTASGLIIRNCTTDIDQQGTSTLLFNSSTASSSAISINDATNVELAYFDLEDNSALTIGSTANENTVLIQAAIDPANHPGFNYKASLYSTEAMGFENIYGSPTSLYSLSPNDTNLTSITTDRTKISGVRLVSDEGSPVGGTSALRGWDINKNATSAELSFNYQNSDIVGQSAIAEYAVMQLDGVNSLLNLPAPGTQIVFDGDTNLYRSAANVLKTDDNFIVGTLTPDRVVVTAPVTNQLASSVVTGTELGYLSGVTSSVQTQINSKVAKAGDTMTGTLQLPAGTTALPSLVFTGSTTTGLSATGGALSFSTNAVEALKISALGVVTIDGLAGAAGIVHNDSSGNLSSSLIVNADIAAGANISDTKLNTISTAGKVANSATTAVSTATPSTIVLRDGSGNFSAGTITASLNGNATTATTATNFSGSLSGDVTGTQSATVVSFVGGQSAANVAAATVLANAATSANTANTIVKRTASGGFSAGAISVTDTVISNSATITPFSTAGVVHNNASGLLSSSLIVNADITNATISNAKLATINSANVTGAIVVRDGSGNFATNMITLAGTTTNATDAATKAYVDSAVSTGLVAKDPAVVVSLTNETISGPATIDGVVLVTNDRVLLTGQTNPIENGLWVVDTGGAWTRPADFANGSTAGQAYVLILSGTLYGGSSWLCNTPTAVVGTDPIGFALFSLPNSTTGANVGIGTGLIFRDKTGNNINFKTLIEGSHFVITNNTDDITLATDATSANTASTIVARDGSGNFSAGTITAALSGNASTATTATNFSGSLSGDVTGTQSATVVSFVGGQTAANVAAATVLANAATSANTANTIVKRDGTGSFSAGTITANLIGTVTGSASLNVLKAGDTMTGTLIMPAGSAASPSIKFTGSTNTGLSAATANTLSFDTAGVERMNIDGSGNVTIDGFTSAGVVHNSSAGLLTSSLIVDADITPGTISNASLATVSSANNANYIVARDGSGNFSAGTITASLNGNATTATTAATATNFSGSLSGDVTGTQSATVVSFVGGQTAANVAAATVLANAATSANTANAIVRRDASGNFNAGTVIASLTGAASLNVLKAGDTMTGTLQLPAGTTAAPSLVFTGSTTAGLSATSGALSFSTNALERMKIASGGTISIDAFTSAGVVHNDASGNLSSSLIVDADIAAGANISDTKLNTISTAGKVANSATTAVSAATPSTIVLRDGSGNFSAGTITASLNGNATTATTATNFSGSLSGDVTGTQSATVVATVGGQSAANVAAATVLANAATSSNTINTIVKRDGSGNFATNMITLNGTTTNATDAATKAYVDSVAGSPGTNINIANTTVKRDNTGSFAAQVISMVDGVHSGNLILSTEPSTSTAGNILKGSSRFIHDFGTDNTFVGINAGNFTMTGTQNTGIGKSALAAMASGIFNTAIGFEAMAASTDNSLNTVVGYQAMKNTSGSGGVCVAIGYQAMLGASPLGNGNVAVGSQTLQNDTAGFNIAVGDSGLKANTTGSFNTAIGYHALTVNTVGSNNIALGHNALAANTTGIDNTALGSNALVANTTGTNTAVGSFALAGNTTGTSNTAVGYHTLTANTVGTNNTALGHLSLAANTTGTDNTAIGFNALTANTVSNNTAVGSNALAANTTGTLNTAVGKSSLAANTIGVRNTALGNNALAVSTIGTDNIALGHNTLTANTTGSNNTAVGSFALAANTIGTLNIAVGSSALQANTTGTSNTAVGQSALATNTIGTNNTAVGQAALVANTTGGNNTAVGKSALAANTIGTSNTAVGVNSLLVNTTGANNTAVGSSALAANTTGTSNTAVGLQALLANTIGINNVAVGQSALQTNTTGVNNVAVGSNALFGNTIGTSNVAVGNSALQTNTTGVNNTAVGNSALVTNSTGFSNTAVGSAALTANTSGAQNTAMGVSALGGNTIGLNNTAFGYQALLSNTTGSGNNAVGSGALQTNTIGVQNNAMGQAALFANTTGINNTAMGHAALQLNTTGQSNTAVGSSALNKNTVDNNTAVGFSALANNTTGASNTAVGYGALIVNTIGSNNTALGLLALTANTTGGNNTAVGKSALAANTIGTNNTAVGTSALGANTTGTQNTALGSGALQTSSIGINNTAVGYNSLALNTTGGGNVAIGVNTLLNNSIGTSNTAIGTGTLQANTTGIQNTGVGGAALQANTIGNNNTGVGYLALLNNTTGIQNIAVGAGSLQTNTTGGDNTAVGYQALTTNSTGVQSTAIGSGALQNATSNYNTAAGYQAAFHTTTGIQNVAIGHSALFTNAGGQNNVAVGAFALLSANGSSNTAIGEGALLNVTSGQNNVAVGLSAGVGNLTTGSNNIYIGAGTGSPANENAVTRIGNNGVGSTCFIGGISVANVGAQPAVLVANTGQLGVNSSTRKVKHAIEDMNDESADILKLRPVTFVYNNDESEAKQYGLIAEEVDEIFPRLVARSIDGEIVTVLYNVLPVLLLNEMQKQHVTIEELKNDNAQRDMLIQNLMERVKALEERA